MINAKKRFELFKRDNYTCQYCWKKWWDVTLEIDHVVPKSKWWSDDFWNLVTSCRECNMWKWQTELNSETSVFSIKVKDLYERIKKTFYCTWNNGVREAREEFNKNFNSKLDTNTSWLIASFLWRWVNLYVHDREWVSKEVHEVALNCAYNNIPMNNSLSELYNDINNKNLLEEKLDEFYKWWDFFDGITMFLEQAFILRDCPIKYNIFDDNYNWWEIKNTNERLNYNITMNIKRFKNPPLWIIKKYSLFPNTECEC